MRWFSPHRFAVRHPLDPAPIHRLVTKTLGAIGLFLSTAVAANPQFPVSGSTPNLFYGVAVTDESIYVVTYGVFNTNGALRRLNRMPPLEETVPPVTVNGARKLRVADGLIHVLYSYNAGGNWRWGLRIFETITLAEIPTDNRILSFGRRALGLDVDTNRIAYVVGDDGLTIIDVSDPHILPDVVNSGPRVLAKSSLVLSGYDVNVVEDIAFVADGLSGLKMIDVGAPTFPRLAGQWRAQKSATDTNTWAVRGVKVCTRDGRRRAHLIGEGHFWMVDVTDPAIPVLLSELPEDGQRVDVSTASDAGNFAFVAGENGMRIYDVGNPLAPVLVSRVSTGHLAEDVVYAAPFAVLADRSGLYMVQQGAIPSPSLQARLLRLNSTGIANLDDRRVDDQGAVSPLVPASNPRFLASQDPGPSAGFKGLVADGVTPLLMQIHGTGIVRRTVVQWSVGLTGGGALAQPIDHYVHVLRDTGWETAAADPSHAIELTPDAPEAYLYFAPLQPWSLIPELDQLHRTNAVSLEAVMRVYQEDTTNLLTQLPFVLRRPPVALISDFPAEPWSASFLAPIQTARGEDFVKVFNHANEALSWLTNTLWLDWMIGRVDCIAHGRGGLEVRQLCQQYRSIDGGSGLAPYRNAQNLGRGWFRRILTVGAPHRGTTLAPYLEGLYQRIEELKSRHFVTLIPQRILTIPQWTAVGSEPLLSPFACPYLGFFTLNPNADYFITMIGGSHDPAARFHLVQTTLNIADASGEDYAPAAFRFVGLGTNFRRKSVFPLGSDGLVDLPSMVAGPSPSDFSGLVNVAQLRAQLLSATTSPREPEGLALADVAHGGADSRLLGRARTQTSTPEMAEHLLAMLDCDDPTRYGPFKAPSPMMESALLDLKNLGSGAVAEAFGEIRLLFLPSVWRTHLDEARTSYDFALRPATNAPLVGLVTWFAEIYGPGPMTDEGVTVTVDPGDSLRARVVVEDSVQGDVVLFASYPTTQEKIAFCAPILVTRREPAHAALVAIEIQPAIYALDLRRCVTPLVVAVYSNGARYRRWLSADDMEVVSSDSSIVNVSNKWHWEGVEQGTAAVTVSHAGFTASSRITVVDPYPPETFQQWLSHYFAPAQLADPVLTGPESDVDNDGLPLIEEYAVAGHPYQPDERGVLSIGVGNVRGTHRLTLMERVSTTLAGAELALERSNNLKDWTPVFTTTGTSADLNHPLVGDSIRAGRYDDLFLGAEVDPGASHAYFRVAFKRW